MKRLHGSPGCLVLVSLFALVAVAVAAQPASRERLRFDTGWRFHLGNDWGMAQSLAKAGTGSGPASESFSDASWRPVTLPHDWVVELPFDEKADSSHGFHPVGPGFAQNSVGWYRRVFELPASDAGRRLWLEFDGAFRDCTVFVNGWFVGHHESGYSSFRYDITDVARCGGRNVVAVKVDASEFEGWFYEGAGLYRHVWLVKTAPLALAPDGLCVRTRFKENSPSAGADVEVRAHVVNAQSRSAMLTLRYVIRDPAGTVVAQATTQSSPPLDPWSERELQAVLPVVTPELWSPESPRLYTLVTTVESDGREVDRQETEFGLRTVGFDVARGFLLNGQPYVLKGTCNHQDHAGVGSALPDRLQYFRVARLKEMGGNAYRTSHNPPTPELLAACDHLGMLVMDECRLLGSDVANLQRFHDQILRDRNHASVAIWSIANEEFGVQSTPAGRAVAATMQRLVRELDPTRPVTYAAPQGNDFDGINSVIQVRGWNYHVGGDMDAYHAAHPAQPNVGTEQGSTVSTRGIYANDPARGYVSAYDDNAPSWAHTAETWWSYFAPRPWLSGGFVWTGFDYRGEPTPYGWPCINSHFGILDTCGFPKDNFWYYQSWWTTNPVLHLLPHWNWPGREGQAVDVRTLSNCQEVELFLNGRSFGKQTIKQNSELKWKVDYAPGVLSAKGFNDGRVVAETKVETTGTPASVRLAPDRSTLAADGADVSVITVSVTDAEGRIMPVASNLVHFAWDGPGRILGVGNGDPSCHEPDVFVPRWPVHTAPVGGWRWHAVADPQKAVQSEMGADFDDSGWKTVNVRSDNGPLREREHGVFRAQFAVSEQDLAAQSVELSFGMIDENGWVYVNGHKVGESHDWQTPAMFNVKPFLRPGTNTVAVGVSNYTGAGGVNKGVHLQFQDKPEIPEWRRSVFNGLAQILVQAGTEPGTGRLTARADGLAPATVTISFQPAAPRPAVP